MNKSLIQFGLLLGALVLILGGLIGYQEYVLTTGDKVILKTAPVDPRDLFRGDYVILSYEITEEVNELMQSEVYIDGEQKAYVMLDTTQSPATVKDVSMKRPESGIYLTGEVTYGWDSAQQISFPSLEQYYVPEGQGRALERMRGEELHVEVSIANGQARIVNLLNKAGEVIDVSELE